MGRKLSFNTWAAVSSALAFSSMLVWTSASGAVPSDKAGAAPTTRQELEREFTRTVRPFMQTYCKRLPRH